MPGGSGKFTVGQLARLSGLTTKALRHYHERGVLLPVEVDELSGYRLYGPEQLEIARQIRVLRDLEVPLAEIRALLNTTDPELAAARLRSHRDRIGARLASLQTSYYFLGKMIEEKEHTDSMPSRPTHISLEPDRQRALAAELFNYVWVLMETEGRTERENDLMVAAAYASRFFWDEIGEPFRLARGEWQISRTCSVAGRPVEALAHADACRKLCETHNLGAFDIGYAYEALARALQIAGDNQQASDYVRKAREIAPQITDTDERELLDSDLDALERA